MNASIPVLLAPGAFPSTQQMRAFADVVRGLPDTRLLAPTRLEDIDTTELPVQGRVVVVAPASALLPVLNRLPRGARTLEVHAVDPTSEHRAVSARVRRALSGDARPSELHCLRVESTQLARPWRARAVRAGRAAELGLVARDAAARTTLLGRAVTGVRGIAQQLDRRRPESPATILSLRIDGAVPTAPPDLLDLRADASGLRYRATSAPGALALDQVRATMEGLRAQAATEISLVAGGMLLLDDERLPTTAGSDWRVTNEAPLVVWN